MTLSKKKSRKVLFIYSCKHNGIRLRYEISQLYQLVREFSQQDEIFILSSTDTLKLVFPSKINVCVNKITERVIMKIIEDKKIDLIVPTIGDYDNLIRKITPKLVTMNIENFHNSFYRNIEDNSLYGKNALQAGFKIDSSFRLRKSKEKETLTTLCIFAIKDSFGNQIIFDTFEIINDSKKNNNHHNRKQKNNDDIGNYQTPVVLHDIYSKKPHMRKDIDRIVGNFGKLLKIDRCFYCIKISIKGDFKIVFDGISYHPSNEMFFSAQRKQINLGKVLFNIYQNMNIVANYNDDKCVSRVRNCKHDFIIGYYNSNNDIQSHNETNDPLFIAKDTENGEYENSESIHSTTNNVPVLLHYNRNDIVGLTKIKYQFDYNKTFDEYILVSIEDDLLNDVNNYVLFYRICNLLSNDAKKKIILLTKRIDPLLSLVNSNIYIAVFDDVDTLDIKKLKTVFNIKKAYITPSAEIEKLIKKLYDNNISLLYQNEHENGLICNDREKLKKICKDNHIPFKISINNDKIKVMHYTSIVDRNKNILSPMLTTEYFNGFVNANCFFYPYILINYYVEDQIKQVFDKLIACISSYGLIDVTFVYKDGDIYIYDISFFKDKKIFYIFGSKRDALFQVLVYSIIGKYNNSASSTLMEDKSDNKDESRPLQNVCFEQIEKQTVTLVDTTKEKVFSIYNKLFAN